MPSSLKFRIFSHDGKKEIARIEDVYFVFQLLSMGCGDGSGCLRVKVGPNKRNLIEVWKLSEDNAAILNDGDSRDFENYINDHIAAHMAAEEAAIERESLSDRDSAAASACLRGVRRMKRRRALRALRESFPPGGQVSQSARYMSDKERAAAITEAFGPAGTEHKNPDGSVAFTVG